MTEETGAAAPTEEQATPQAPSEQATPETSVQADAAPENAETKAKPDEGAADEDKPRKQSTSERYRRKISAQAGVIERMQAELEAIKQKTGQDGTDLPKADQYPQGEWDPGYIADLAAHKAAAKISETLSERDKRGAVERAAATRQEMVEDFEDRAAQFKVLTPDFDTKVADLLKTLPNGFVPHVTEELMESEVGPALLYQLASDPRKAAELNAMSPREVAREIGRLEGKTSLPNPKKQTSAPPPLKTPSGAAAKPVDLTALAKSDDMSAFIAMRREQSKARA
jgi:hypothetical protein